MNKPITIMLPIVPPTKTHQHKKIVNIGKHAKLADTKELKLVISDYLTLLKPYQPARPLTKPDWDNLAKTLQDVLTRLRFWEDDAQVYSASVEKWWGEEPQITITIR